LFTAPKIRLTDPAPTANLALLRGGLSQGLSRVRLGELCSRAFPHKENEDGLLLGSSCFSKRRDCLGAFAYVEFNIMKGEVSRRRMLVGIAAVPATIMPATLPFPVACPATTHTDDFFEDDDNAWKALSAVKQSIRLIAGRRAT
jgi:hypothetical protein